ncbi:hypothetical protein H0H81_004234 [Sphagnurus paluster]|uniref:BTB domain-containing protein n=1 Tax=Sphagnurus paluster TaxID=117069 RepID=A0A9P7FYR6_9AGAR|nr:hypothetical protein H0H81_004234 [Sphagnurus paluster]
MEANTTTTALSSTPSCLPGTFNPSPAVKLPAKAQAASNPDMAGTGIRSALFNAHDADITFRSADKIFFKIHSQNLKTNTGGFSAYISSGTSGDAIAELKESSATLETIFQFIYPARHPSLEKTDFATLKVLAEAAEKYQVFAAMNFCYIRMKSDIITSGFKYSIGRTASIIPHRPHIVLAPTPRVPATAAKKASMEWL